ncbi:MAG: glycosyltransferase family 4 protein [Acidobacteria bacterium]|nr:glycosyltransferase family 4 protein [Acidobacteriota bacterium]
MNIAHIGPPLARRGGPAGYLLQLSAAAARHAGDSPHMLTFPRQSVPARARPPGIPARVKSALRPIKRALVGPPAFYRPSEADLRRPGGAIDALLTASMQSVCAEAAGSIDAALAGGADVLFAHDPAVAERLLELRRPGQQVWSMMHAPMPVGLDLAWAWGIPEWDWKDIAALPDTNRWMRWELGVYSAIDRLITPCPEAAAEIARADPRFAELTFDFVLTGAAGPTRAFLRGTPSELRRRWRLPAGAPVGLFIGAPLPYRGLDALLEAVTTLPQSVPGVIAVAGPPRERVRAHARVRALGPVRDVADLLHAVDFVVNVNRFNLFDLSTIEAAEAGRPMLLHATGGNLRFQQLGLGCVMLADLAPATIASGLRDLFTMTQTRRAELGAASRRCYEQHLTPEHLWRGHTALYDRAAAALLHS